jgi:hypothetical protein
MREYICLHFNQTIYGKNAITEQDISELSIRGLVYSETWRDLCVGIIRPY